VYFRKVLPTSKRKGTEVIEVFNGLCFVIFLVTDWRLKEET
jgi:hypothetical protein